MVLFLLEFCFSFHGMLLLDSLGSRRGVIGVDVDGWSWDALVASPVRSAVVWCILPVCRVRVAYTLVRTQRGGFVFGIRDLTVFWVSRG